MQRTKTSREAKAHYAAIDAIVDRWHDGDITLEEKYRLILEENRFYYGQDRRSPTTHRSLTQPGEDVLLPPTIDRGDEQEELWYQKM